MTGFRTTDGRRVPAVTADEMAEVDRVAVDRGLELLMMMENAGRALAATCADYPDPAVVYAGGGGNGGGGLCAARHLANAEREVRVVLDRDPADLTGAPAVQRRVLAETDATVTTDPPGDAGVVVDALVGYGLTDPLRGRAAALVDALPDAPVVSLDVPTGVDATTGRAPGPAVDPTETLTLALPKTGLAERGGDLRLADIGVPAGVYERAGVEYADPFGGRARVPLERI